MPGQPKGVFGADVADKKMFTPNVVFMSHPNVNEKVKKVFSSEKVYFV